MLSWLVGHRLQEHRDRVLVTWAGLAPDLDGLSILGGMEEYSKWHHAVGHGLLWAFITIMLCSVLAGDRVKVAVLAFTVFHLHLLCDLLGSGLDWPIQYWWPINDTWYVTPYGWEFDSWQNWIIAIALLLMTVRLALTTGHSFAESFLTSQQDREIVQTLRRRLKWQTV
jgi:inner membrane protein